MGKLVGPWEPARPPAPAGGPPWRRACASCGRPFETAVFPKATCSARCAADNRRAVDRARREARRAGASPPGRRIEMAEKACACGGRFRPRSGRQLRCDACRGARAAPPGGI